MLLEKFYGDDLTAAQYDELAIKAIGEKFLVEEPELFQKKWFDYQHLHSTKATYLYAAHYTLEYQKIYQKFIDIKKGEFVKGTKGKDAMGKAETAGFWKGRQAADRIGMPYNLFIGSAMNFLIEGNVWKRIPRPTHLYSKKVIEHVEAKWDELLEASIIEPQISHLSDENRCSLECKQNIERWLCERIRERQKPVYGLSHFLFNKKLISEQTAIQFFDSQMIERARQLHLDLAN